MLCILETSKWALEQTEKTPDEMHQNVAFHLGLHCLLRLKQSSGTEIQYYLEILTYDPLVCIMKHPV